MTPAAAGYYNNITLLANVSRLTFNLSVSADNRTATLSGVVTKVDWVNPHAYIFINFKGENGELKDMRLELGPPYALVRGGWKKDTVKIGDKITVEGAALAKDPRNHWAGALPTTFLVLPGGDKLPMR